MQLPSNKASTVFYAAHLLGWPLKNISVYFEVPVQAVENWALGKSITPDYVFAALVLALRDKSRETHPDEKERYIRAVVQKLVQGIELDSIAEEEAHEFMKSRMDEYILERAEPYLEKIDHLERVREGEPSRNFQRFVQNIIDCVHAELVETLRNAGLVN